MTARAVIYASGARLKGASATFTPGSRFSDIALLVKWAPNFTRIAVLIS
ncbi:MULTISPECIES: hypothetical protein [unclassified Sphingomonas]|jgi:hypothetical protein|nr:MULTISPECIES: hypothetical protein [unclassified Sphingomonas]